MTCQEAISQREADARLMAAGPELLAMLRLVERHRKIGERMVILADEEWDRLHKAVEAAEWGGE